MQLNVSVATLNTMLRLLVIYRYRYRLVADPRDAQEI